MLQVSLNMKLGYQLYSTLHSFVSQRTGFDFMGMTHYVNGGKKKKTEVGAAISRDLVS